MPRLRSVPVPHSLRRPRSSLPFSPLTRPSSTCCPPPRTLSTTAHVQNDDLFNYTSGRWIMNDALRHAERRRVFNVDGLRHLAAASVDRSSADIVNLQKLAEGGFNRSFLLTMRDDFQMVARIPYPATIPKKLTVASEVATMAFLRSSGLPIPEVYGYSASADNAAETEFIFMQFVPGTSLSDIWFDHLEENDITSIMSQVAELESKMMSTSFPAGGSLYFSKDLETLVGNPGIPLQDERFCVGPDTRLPLWYGKRAQLDVDRGPYENAEAALIRGAEKELAYLKQFGRPRLPFQRARRAAYQYQQQPPSSHIENLERYLLLAPSLVPKDPALVPFRIRHPDLQPSNILVSHSPDSGWHIDSLIDWQHTAILPLFLLAGVPRQLQTHHDLGSESITPPMASENLDENQQREETERRRSRLVQSHYVKSTEEHNKLHYAALTDPIGLFRRRLFRHASDPWEGETLALKVALLDAWENWQMVSSGGCPIAFTAADVRETRELDKEQREVDVALEACRAVIGHGPEGWVPVGYYEEAMERSRQLRRDGLDAAESEGERAEVEKHWPFDDMDEEEYL